MKIDELKHTLSELADDGTIDPLDHPSRLGGVESKVVESRRRRIAVAGGGVVAAIAVAALAAPALVPDADRGAPTPPTTSNHDGTPDEGDLDDTDLATVTDDGVVFYADAGGSSLIDEAVSQPGDSSLSMTVTPETTDLSFVVECWRVTTPTAKPPHFVASVNGHFMASGECDRDPYGPLTGDLSNGNNPADNQSGWEALGVTAGASSDISVRLVGPGVTDRGDVRLVVGLFTAPDKEQVDGIWYSTQVVHQGIEYQSIAANSGHFTNQRHYEVSAELAPSDQPYYVLGGSGHVSGRGVVRVADSAFLAADEGGISAGNVFSSEDSPVIVRFHSAKAASGRLYLVIYEPVR
jgi:hypothetical protein